MRASSTPAVMSVFRTLADFEAARGTTLGSSEWLQIDQARIDAFAAATDDYQWIHVDPERASSGPFGSTIAHGWLTASLLPRLVSGIYRIEARMGINYGLNRLRFPAPVPVGSRVRATSVLKDVEKVGEAVQIVVETTVEIDNGTKPALVAETVSRYYL